MCVINYNYNIINYNKKKVGWIDNLKDLNNDLSRLTNEEKEMNVILRAGKEGDTEEN